MLPAAAAAGDAGAISAGPDPVPVAIKVAMARQRDRHDMARDQLLNEVDVLSRARHRSLVRLLGYCIERVAARHAHVGLGYDELLLVYEFVPNGTLQEELTRTPLAYPSRLNWARRMELAVQTAEALNYLHVHVTPSIIHRDVKSANILLDANWNAKVADFGLSKLKEDEDASHLSTIVKGTPGYLDPDYHSRGQLTAKSDVYSLGVVLLELLTARKPIDRDGTLAAKLVPLILATGPDSRRNFIEVLDHQLRTTPDTTTQMLDAMHRVAQVAAVCLSQDSASRPPMAQVVEMLRNIRGSQLSPEIFLTTARPQGGPRPPAAPGFNYGRPGATVSSRSSDYSNSGSTGLNSGRTSEPWSSSSEV